MKKNILLVFAVLFSTIYCHGQVLENFFTTEDFYSNRFDHVNNIELIHENKEKVSINIYIKFTDFSDVNSLVIDFGEDNNYNFFKLTLTKFIDNRGVNFISDFNGSKYYLNGNLLRVDVLLDKKDFSKLKFKKVSAINEDAVILQLLTFNF